MNKKDMKKDDWWNTPFSKDEYEQYYKMKHKVITTDKQIMENFWIDCDISKTLKDYDEILENIDFFDED